MKGLLRLVGFVLSLGTLISAGPTVSGDKVLPPISQGNLTIFPVVSQVTFDTSVFLTLDQGIRCGEVVVTEAGRIKGLVRPRATVNDGVWRERPFPPITNLPQDGPRVNELSLINNSNRPLLLLAGEIVTGGKQDRVVSKDRIIPAHSEPVALGVFCVEPHRWTETSSNFNSLHSSMAQPSVRSQAMFARDQQQVWNQVAKSRMAVIDGLPHAAAAPLSASSSYAAAMQSSAVQAELDTVVKPLEQSYASLIQKLRDAHAVGTVVAVNGEIIWADVFASSDLLNRFWPKLIRSYAAESFAHPMPVSSKSPATEQQAQDFLDNLGATHETVDTEPGLYRNTEISSPGYSAFVLTSLLPSSISTCISPR